MATAPRLAIRGLRLAFGPHRVLDGVDLEVAAGDRLALIGISGSGKSVLVKCLLGLLEPQAGSIQVDGVDSRTLSRADHDDLMRRFGVLFQRGALFDSLTVWENVAFVLTEGRGMDRAPAREAALRALGAVGLDAETADLSPAELSGGMQKRVALARAIVGEPEILILDDPVAGLDPILTASIDALIRRSVDHSHATCILITQDPAVIRRVASRVAMLHDGRIVWEGPVERVEDSGNAYVDQLIHGRAKGPIRVGLPGR